MRRGVLALAVLTIVPLYSQAQTRESKSPFLAYPRNRIMLPIDDQRRVVLPGNRHPLAQDSFKTGSAPGSLPMGRMILLLRPDREQQAALDDLVSEQQDPNSPYYHQWLSPERYGELFGASDNDIRLVVNWLQSQGMKVEEITPSRRAIVFSGTAAKVTSAFHTRIQIYDVHGQAHYANESDPQIPQALASVVDGVASLHDFRSQPLHVTPTTAVPMPAFSSGTSHYLSPADFATIYNLTPLYQRSIDGTGKSIAVIGRSNLKLSDVRTFRSNFGLPTKDPEIVLTGADPGIISPDEQVEATLDVEWAGAVAKNAAVKYVLSASTNSSDGVYLSSQYAVNRNIAPVMSVSFGLCEAALGSSGNSFLKSLWQQAASQGITVFVSSGDSGAAGCDASGGSSGTHGRGINGLCSPPYSVCVGGTQFDDVADPAQYWGTTNDPQTTGSALSYIPEGAWNESAGGGLWSSGGGASTIYPKPTWQTGTGVPADGKRDVPDVSLKSAIHDGYLIYMNGSLLLVGGTSAASPSLAGIMALVLQNTGVAQGNANPGFYGLASKQQSGGAAIFHDVTAGDNSVPGVNGFNATPGYDLVTGLGSVDANLLVTSWGDTTTPPIIAPSFQLSSSTNPATLQPGKSTSVMLTTSTTGNFANAVSLAVSNRPAGLAVGFSPTKITAPRTGKSILTLTAASTLAPGSYPLTIIASGGGVTRTLSLTVNIVGFAFRASPPIVVLRPNGRATVTLTTTTTGGFNSPVSFSTSTLPKGITRAFSATTISAPGSGTSTLTLTRSSTARNGTSILTIIATGGGITKTSTPTLNVLAK